MTKNVINVPFIRQLENYCVVASLAMVFRYFGRDETQSEIADWFGYDVKREGVRSDAETIHCAKQYGFTAYPKQKIGLEGIIRAINRDALIIATIKHERCFCEHVVVITGYSTNPSTVFLNDPLLTKYSLPYEKFANLWRIRKKYCGSNQYGIIIHE